MLKIDKMEMIGKFSIILNVLSEILSIKIKSILYLDSYKIYVRTKFVHYFLILLVNFAV
ncbi:MAG: hypothetical protein OHK0057_24880 [Thermoflexibacter sp.]